MRSSIKLYPACHQSHAFFNAAIALSREHKLRPQDIEAIRVRVAEPAVPLVCEPLAIKRKPDSSYAAQFSLPYGIACCLIRGRFGLEHLESASYSDPGLIALAHKVDYEVDPNPGFPKSRSGEVIVKTTDGRTLSRRENILPDEPASDEQIIDKFMDSAASAMSIARARHLRDAILDIENVEDMRCFGTLLGT